jgi:hypothetical protein
VGKKKNKKHRRHNLPPHAGATTAPNDQNKAHSWKQWATGWRLLLGLLTVLGTLLAVYGLRPVLSVTLLSTSRLHPSLGTAASITYSGMTGIKKVTVQCVTNKVVFDGPYTLELINYALINEYSVPDVQNGESFMADCFFAWSMYMGSANGFFTLGTIRPDIIQTQTLGIPFGVKDGMLTPTASGGQPKAITSNLVGYSNRQATDVDGSIIVRYEWPWSWFRQQRIIHIIASRTGQGLSWRVAPKSEPVIPDSGFKVTVKSTGADFAITMKSLGAS